MADSVASLLEGTTTDAKLALRLLREDGVQIEAGSDKLPCYRKADGTLAPLDAGALRELLGLPHDVPRCGTSRLRRTRRHRRSLSSFCSERSSCGVAGAERR